MMSKNHRLAAADRAADRAAAEEARRHVRAQDGQSNDEVQALFADELTRRPVPNRADRRRAEKTAAGR